jgi:DNA-binding SARP family transcriptional activator
MITLRMLGAVSVRSSTGTELHVVLRRPKRLALLAYLAAARPHGFHARDGLIGLLWPDLDQAGARNALRQAVHHLRHALGPEVIPARGTSGLGVDDCHLSSDVADFEACLERGDPHAALATYHGDFLAGFHVPGAVEFSHWLDQERERLRAKAVAAALSLAQHEEERGNVVGAARAATRALHASPYAETALRRLVRILDRAGDRAEAMRLYEAFARRLAADLGVEPTPETRAAIEAIRRRA